VSHKNINPSAPAAPKRVAMVLSNPAVSSTTGWPVGFWWAELTHPYFRFSEVGYDVELFSPLGGRCEADPMSDPEDASQWQAEDVISRGYKHDPQFLKLVETTRTVDEIGNLHAKFTEFYEAGRLCAALCHGVALLRYTRLSSGESLVAGKTVTGFANVEEDFADQFVWDSGSLPADRHVMPWRIEDELKALGANFIQAGLWRGFAIRDGYLITGQQNFSGGDTADLIVETLGR
jgi:putative intracellular protease/amidase